MEVACRNLIATVMGNAREILLTLDRTDPKTQEGLCQTVRMNVRPMVGPCPLYCARTIVFVFGRTPSSWKTIMQPPVETPTALASNRQI
jgi:hypothetical protein